MPNWNVNSMKIVGEPKAVVKFIKENYSTERDRHGNPSYLLDYEKLLPTPLKENGDIIDEWYIWRIENWGTKWTPGFEQNTSLTIKYKDENVEDKLLTEYWNSDEATFNEKSINELLDNESEMKELVLESSYDTAWAPPYGIFMKWVELYKDELTSMSNKYYEPGCCFAGEFTWNKGDENMTDNFHELCDDDDASYIKYLLDEEWEHVEWYIEMCSDLVKEMNPDLSEEELNRLLQLIEDTLSKESNDNCAKLIADIINKHREFENNKNN